MVAVRQIGNFSESKRSNPNTNRVYDKSGLCPTLNTMQGGNRQPMVIDELKTIVAMRGRNPENPSAYRTVGAKTEQRLEPNGDGVCNTFPESKLRRGRAQGGGDVSPTLTSSNLGVCKVESRYRIRKLTPKECWRLMGFSDEDFDKAQAVNSNSQLYKQAGNSIVKDVLMAIFRQMNIKGVEPWSK